jgi:hypothetical protein
MCVSHIRRPDTHNNGSNPWLNRPQALIATATRPAVTNGETSQLTGHSADTPPTDLCATVAI